KTGTTTNGKPEVTDSTGSAEALHHLASAEKGSQHPLAETMASYATKPDVDVLEADDFSAIPGHGIQATMSNRDILVGNRKLMKDDDVAVGEGEQELVDYEVEGKTAMLIAIDGKYRGVVAVADTIKETAPQAIKELKDQGLEVIMLTG